MLPLKKNIMKNLLLLSFCLLTVSCVSVKFPESISVNIELDEESAKNLTQAINNSSYKTIVMGNNFEEDGKKLKKVMIRGERFGVGPNASKYMNNLPEVIIRRIEKATEKGVDIKIDTIISNNGERKEIKIEVKIDDN
ncbi:hypothetical protein N8673_00710 [Flavobacteriaceae bacterium]|nr:hypothetical protein [Flavobacteriaceae bacterium]